MLDKIEKKNAQWERREDPDIKESRLTRMGNDRNSIVPKLRESYVKIENFCQELSDYKEQAIEMSKKFIEEMDEEARKDRAAWLARKHEYE